MDETGGDSDTKSLKERLYEEGKVYETHQDERKLLALFRDNPDDCRDILTAVVDGDDLANAFVRSGSRSNVDVMRTFLDHGVNANICDIRRRTALMHACHKNHQETLDLLLERKVDVNMQDADGWSPLMIGCWFGCTEVVEALLERNANVDFQNKKGATALMHVCLKGRLELVRLLLNHNADTQLQDADGKTAFDVAKTKEIKELLENHVITSYVLK